METLGKNREKRDRTSGNHGYRANDGRDRWSASAKRQSNDKMAPPEEAPHPHPPIHPPTHRLPTPFISARPRPLAVHRFRHAKRSTHTRRPFLMKNRHQIKHGTKKEIKPDYERKSSQKETTTTTTTTTTKTATSNRVFVAHSFPVVIDSLYECL